MEQGDGKKSKRLALVSSRLRPHGRGRVRGSDQHHLNVIPAFAGMTLLFHRRGGHCLSIGDGIIVRQGITVLSNLELVFTCPLTGLFFRKFHL